MLGVKILTGNSLNCKTWQSSDLNLIPSRTELDNFYKKQILPVMIFLEWKLVFKISLYIHVNNSTQWIQFSSKDSAPFQNSSPKREYFLTVILSSFFCFLLLVSGAFVSIRQLPDPSLAFTCQSVEGACWWCTSPTTSDSRRATVISRRVAIVILAAATLPTIKGWELQ